MNDQQHKKALLALRQAMESYAPLSDGTWEHLSSICHIKQLKKNEILYKMGVLPRSFSFVYQGLVRCFITDEKGNEYNKTFFEEGAFPGSMASLLRDKPSEFTFDALESSILINIDFKAYRKLLVEKDDLKLYHIHYLEKNWLLAKDAREVEIVQENATERYQRFLHEQASLASRVSQYHIASHLGITPTQLSRIRKNK